MKLVAVEYVAMFFFVVVQKRKKKIKERKERKARKEKKCLFIVFRMSGGGGVVLNDGWLFRDIAPIPERQNHVVLVRIVLVRAAVAQIAGVAGGFEVVDTGVDAGLFAGVAGEGFQRAGFVVEIGQFLGMFGRRDLTKRFAEDAAVGKTFRACQLNCFIFTFHF